MARRVEGWFQSDHEDLWQFIVVVQPPWNNVDFLDVLKHHWRSTIQVRPHWELLLSESN